MGRPLDVGVRASLCVALAAGWAGCAAQPAETTDAGPHAGIDAWSSTNDAWSMVPVDAYIAPRCGDGHCDDAEDCDSCETDCGGCAPGATCGDGTCAGTENCDTCARDCGGCSVGCGDGLCQGAENCFGCPRDCGACDAGPVRSVWCGDSVCAPTESCASCAVDCCTGGCGDGVCVMGEYCSTCPEDCGRCSDCGSYTDCGRCTFDTRCGWCGLSGGGCRPGSVAGPVGASCTGSWYFGACDATVDPCGFATDCASCASHAGCGWCGGQFNCRSGSSSGPTRGTCPSHWTTSASSCTGGCTHENCHIENIGGYICTYYCSGANCVMGDCNF